MRVDYKEIVRCLFDLEICVETGMNFHMVGIGAAKGLSEKEVARVFPWISFGTILGSIGVGLTGVADSYDKLLILVAAFLVTILSMAILVISHETHTFFLFGFVFGFSFGVQSIVSSTIWSELFGRKHLGNHELLQISLYSPKFQRLK